MQRINLSIRVATDHGKGSVRCNQDTFDGMVPVDLALKRPPFTIIQIQLPSNKVCSTTECVL